MFIEFYNSIFWALKAFVGTNLLIGVVTIGLLAAQFLVTAQLYSIFRFVYIDWRQQQPNRSLYLRVNLRCCADDGSKDWPKVS